MTRVVSVHEYVLKPGVSGDQFEAAIRQSREEGLLQLPGLIDYYLLKGIRGTRQGAYAAVWIYESQAAWAKLWGPVGQPHSQEEYPENWKVWEEQVLAPLLDQDPDRISFTTYEAL